MGSSSRTLVCSVLFIDIVEYSKKSVSEQLQLKQAFNALLAAALDPIPSRDRVILDTGDGAAVTFMGDPEDALFAAMSVRDKAGVLPVRLGINLGPVRVVKDLNDQVNIIGDGINVAQRVMAFARPGQLLVSRSFYEVVACLSRDYSSLFHHEGSRTDKHVRAHEVYSVLEGTPARRLAETTQGMEALHPRRWLEATGPLGIRVSALVAAPLAFLAIAGSGVMAAVWLREEPRAAAAIAAKPTTAASEKSPLTLPPPKPKAAAPQKKALAKSDTTPAQGPGRIELAIAPWGEILIDGRPQGVSPPLSNLEIAPGPHTIEVRNSTFPSHIAQVDVKAGEAIRIRHRFK
jgi:class 3 adenylate cyclase